MEMALNKKPRDAFYRWKDWLNNVKNKGLLDQAKAIKL